MRQVSLCTLVLLFFYCTGLKAQKAEKKEKDSCNATSFCKTGVLNKSMSKGIAVEYDLVPSYYLHTTSSNKTVGESRDKIGLSGTMKFKLKAPLYNGEGLKVMLGFKYYKEQFQFNTNNLDFELHQNLDNRSLKNVAMSLYVLKPMKNKFYVAFKGEAAFRGDYTGFLKPSKDNLSYNVTAALGIKKSERTEWGIGLLYKYSFGNHIVLPGLVFNHTFNEKWGIESTLPQKIMVRYNACPKTILLAGSEIKGNSYYLNTNLVSGTASNSLLMQNTELRTGIQVQREVFGPVWAGVNLGMRNSLGINFEDPYAGQNELLIQSSPSMGMYATFSLFLTTPKKFRK